MILRAQSVGRWPCRDGHDSVVQAGDSVEVTVRTPDHHTAGLHDSAVAEWLRSAGRRGCTVELALSGYSFGSHVDVLILRRGERP